MKKVHDWVGFYAILAGNVLRDRFPVNVIRSIGNRYMMKNMLITWKEFSATRLRSTLSITS